jgi:hypothetical protein
MANVWLYEPGHTCHLYIYIERERDTKISPSPTGIGPIEKLTFVLSMRSHHKPIAKGTLQQTYVYHDKCTVVCKLAV